MCVKVILGGKLISMLITYEYMNVNDTLFMYTYIHVYAYGVSVRCLSFKPNSYKNIYMIVFDSHTHANNKCFIIL